MSTRPDYYERIASSKQTFRKGLSALPIAEKLRLLDAMRERELAIRAARPERLSAAGVRPEKVTGGGRSEK